MRFKLLLSLFLLLNIACFSQKTYQDYQDLVEKYNHAISIHNNMPERYSVVAAFSNFDETYFKNVYTENWQRMVVDKYKYIATLLSESYEPEDLVQAVEYYHFHIKNYINQWKVKDENSQDLLVDKITLSQLYLSKFLYYCLSYQVDFDPAYAVSESSRLLHGGDLLLQFPQTDMTRFFVLGLDTNAVKYYDPKYYQLMLAINHKQNGVYMNRIGIIHKNMNLKKEAKDWFKKAISLGCEEARTNLANINKPVISTYGAFDYRLVAPDASAVYQTLARPTGSSTAAREESRKYDEWWQRTYGKGGTQNSTQPANYNSPPSMFKPSKPTDAEQHRKNIEKIQYETEKQMRNGFRN